MGSTLASLRAGGVHLPDYIEAQISEFEPEKRACILVHGMASCNLDAKIESHAGLGEAPDGYFNNYVNVLRLITHREQTLQSLKIEYRDGRALDQPGVDTRPVHGRDGIHSMARDSKFRVPLWQHIIEALEAEHNLLPVNYDWRKWGCPSFCKDYCREFRGAVECSMKVTGERPVDVIAHSMGPFVVLYCLHELGDRWTRKHIRKLVFVAPAPMGAPIMFPSYASGPIPRISNHIHIPVSLEEDIAQASSTWACLVAEFPQPVGGIDTWPEGHVFVETPSKKYTKDNIQEYLDDITAHAKGDRHVGATLYKGATEVARRQAIPAVETHLIYCNRVNTPMSMRYDKDDFSVWPKITQNVPGDGTIVGDTCVKLVEAWRAHHKGHEDRYQLHEIARKVEHKDTISCKETIKLVPEILKAEEIKTEGPKA